MGENQDSVYHLISRLCELHSEDEAGLKRLRSRCFETLLGKRVCKNPRKFKDVKGLDDPFLSLLHWSFRLSFEFGLREASQRLVECLDQFKKDYVGDVDGFNRILKFFFIMRDMPPNDDNNKLDLSTLPDISDDLLKLKRMFSLFNMPVSNSMDRAICSSYESIENNPREVEFLELKDETYFSSDKILELASKIEYSNRRNWEDFGFSFPDKEKPFLSETKELSSLWVANLESLYFTHRNSGLQIQVRVKTKTEITKYLKYALVGIPSDIFGISEKGVFFLMPDVISEDITQDALERFCRKFLFCAGCYRALSQLTSPDPFTQKYKQPGYIFKEFCQSLGAYLQFYRTAVFTLPDSTNFLDFQRKTIEIRRQIVTLTSVCKVGPFESSVDEIPHGVSLLNYLYKKVVALHNEKLRLVLYSVLYPCCQVYLSRFVHQWIFKGCLNDTYGEFFITPRPKYITTRGRTYWTRSYEIKQDIVPDFLLDLKETILYCGKMMNLLEICDPTNKLCVYLRGSIPITVQCYLTHGNLKRLEQNAASYFLEVSSECGSKFDFADVLERSKLENDHFLASIAKKRALTLARIEMERQRRIQEEHEKKMEELNMLREQYEAALLHKQLKICKEIETEIEDLEENLKIERKREDLIGSEAKKMIGFYAELTQAVENRKSKVEDYLKTVKNISIDHDSPEIERFKSTENVPSTGVTTSEESFYSVPEEGTDKVESIETKSQTSNEDVYTVHSDEELKTIHTSESLDLINANATVDNRNVNANMQQVIDNFEFARQIKRKVLGQEFDIQVGQFEQKAVAKTDTCHARALTDAQRNKLKVMSSEFGIEVIAAALKKDATLSAAEINRNKVLGTNACFYADKRLDNENFINRNVDVATVKKSKSLHLDLEVTKKNSQMEKPTLMSLGSTPLSDFFLTPSTDMPQSASTVCLSFDMNLDSHPTTSDIQSIDNKFHFVELPKQSTVPVQFSKTIDRDKAKDVVDNNLKLFLYESVSIPLLTQKKLVNNEVLKYFILELNYLKHLTSLRDYFFLQDGEFGRNITENLFEKLYEANFPLELINCRTLQHLVFSALDNSSKFQEENSRFLSFKINSLPKCFDLGDPDVLDCLSLTYKVYWPLNILLPSDVMSKYDRVFKYLVKMTRVSWVLKKIFLELKVLAKETGKKEIYLMSSPQYRRLHQCRHVMTHFVQTLQNYIVGEVLQPSWDSFEKRLTSVTNLDELYEAHSIYIKDILFRCHLTQKTVAMRNIIQKIFVVILKFYDYLRSRRWRCVDGAYVHPNFEKLEKIFKNFEEFVAYMFRAVEKLTRTGYQPHLAQFIDVLDVNEYYSNKIAVKSQRK